MGKKILIVDDHEVMREGVRSLIAKYGPEWTVCGEATNGLEAMQFVQEFKPDIVVMDLAMPGMSGLEASARMREMGITIPVLIFTMHHSDGLKNNVRDAAAQGYVLKSQAARDLMVAIETLLAGGTFFGPHSQRDESEAEQPKIRKLFFRVALAN
jgi:DNA-binding NarL/FixJ family response regulator